jgi:2',3'-cyclic-nucleotide 2'-phosphodiesterase (5'-nucleotidase family)
VSDQYCKPKDTKAPAIDWPMAVQPSFLKPYVIKQVAGLRVALIGLDNPETPIVTTEANVTDLCFDDEAASYLRVRKELDGQADVFVVIMHDGNTDASFGVSDFVGKLPAGSVDAVISGHTHFVTNTRVNGIAIIQSGANGEKFGRIDLVYDMKARAVLPAKTRSYGGIDLLHDRCAPAAADFCTAAAGKVSYEGVPVTPNAAITALVTQGRAQVASLANQHLGSASATVKIDRTRESPLANAMTDALQGLAHSDIAFMNTGGLRAAIPAGEFTYETLFRVIPFNNHGLLVGPMGADKVISLLQRSISTCGAFGALMQSGLRVTFERDCSRQVAELDPKARLLTVETLGGEKIFDAANGGLIAAAGRTFNVATLDFLAAGGSGFDDFKGTPVLSDIGIAREAMATYYVSNPVTLSAKTDGRWAEKLPEGAVAPTSR